MQVWVLTSAYNEHAQYGSYLEELWGHKPTKEELIEAGVPEKDVGHVLAGGGRQDIEYQWYCLEEHTLS